MDCEYCKQLRACSSCRRVRKRDKTGFCRKHSACPNKAHVDSIEAPDLTDTGWQLLQLLRDIHPHAHEHRSIMLCRHVLRVALMDLQKLLDGQTECRSRTELKEMQEDVMTFFLGPALFAYADGAGFCPRIIKEKVLRIMKLPREEVERWQKTAMERWKNADEI